MTRPTKKQRDFQRKIRPESAARMRRRLKMQAFLRSLFWQGANCGKPARDDIDPKLCRHIEQDQFNELIGMGINLKQFA